LQHGAKTNIDSMRWWQKKELNSIIFVSISFLPDRYVDEGPLLFKIRSIQVAKLLIPHLDMNVIDDKGIQ